MSMNQKYPVLKAINKFTKRLFIVLSVFTLVFLGFALFLFSRPGQPLLIYLLSRGLKAQNDLHVSFEHIRATNPSTLHIRELAITSNLGRRLAYMPDVEMHFSILQLLHGNLPLETVNIPYIEINGTSLERLMHKKRSQAPFPSIDIPKWLLAGNLHLTANHVVLNHTELEPIALDGRFNWSPLQQHLELNFIEKTLNSNQPQMHLQVTRTFEHIHLSFDAQEVHHSSLLKQTPLAQWNESNLHLSLDGSQSAWTQLLQENDNGNRITGVLSAESHSPYGPASIYTKMEIGPEFHLNSKDLYIQTMGWTASGRMQLKPMTSDFDIALSGPIAQAPDFLSEFEVSSASASLELAGNNAQYEGSCEIKANRMFLPGAGESVADPILWAQIKGGTERNTQIQFSLSSNYAEQPLHIDTFIEKIGNEWSAQYLKAISKGFEMDVRPSSDSENPGWNLQMQVDWQQSLLSQILLQHFGVQSGSLKVFAHCSPIDHQNPIGIDFDTQIQELTYKDWRAQNVTGTGRIRIQYLEDLQDIRIESLNMELEQLEKDRVPLADLISCSTYGNWNAAFFQLSAKRASRFEENDTFYEIETEGLLDFSGPQPRISVEEVRGNWAGLELQTTQSTIFEIGPKIYRCSDFEIELGDGKFSCVGFWSADRVKFHATLTKVPTNLAYFIIGRPLWGDISGSIDLDASNVQSFADIALQLQGLRIHSQHTPAGDVNGYLIGHWRGDRLVFNIQLKSPLGESLQASAEGTWQALTSPTSWSKLGMDKDHDIRIYLEGRLGLFSHLFTIEDFDFDGIARANLHTWGQPQEAYVEGSLNVKDGSYDHYSIGLKLRGVQATLHGEDRTIILDKLEASDGTKGYAQAHGILHLSGGLRSESNLHLERFCFIHTPLVKSWASGDCIFSHHGLSAALKGELSLDSTQIQIPDLLPSPVPEFDAYTIIRYPGEQTLQPSWTKPTSKQSEAATDKIQGVIAFDLHLKIPSKATLSGRGLQSSWQGQVHLTGHDAHPLLHGQVQLQEGEFLFGGRRFIVREGEVEFAGQPAQDTQIHIASELALDRATIRAILNGPLLHPRLQFKSTPNMASVDLFSHVLFGKSHSNLSAFQALQVAHLALETSGDPNADVFTQLRRSTGVDRIEIEARPGTTANSTDDVYTLKVGKYISDGFLIGISKNVTTEGTQLTLEIDLTKHLSLITELGYLSDSSLNLMWKKDY